MVENYQVKGVQKLSAKSIINLISRKRKENLLKAE